MCGRIARTSPREAIAKGFGVTRFAEVDWHPRYNVAPSQIVENIISVDGEKRPGPMRWGFVLSTAKERKLASTHGRELGHLTDVPGGLPPSSLPRRSRRFLRVEKERRTQEDAVLHPAQVRSSFGFAGIWSMKHDEKGTRLATCAIATCPPNELVAKLHDRMPVILPPGARDRWLDPTRERSRAS
jgi:putative SOS response-associated peptidase YedK